MVREGGLIWRFSKENYTKFVKNNGDILMVPSTWEEMPPAKSTTEVNVDLFESNNVTKEKSKLNKCGQKRCTETIYQTISKYVGPSQQIMMS